MQYLRLSVVTLSIGVLITPLMAQSPAAPHTNAVVSRLSDELPNIRNYILEMETSPTEGRFQRTQQDVQDDLDELLDEIIDLIVGTDYDVNRERLFKAEEEINTLELEIDELRIQRIDASPSPAELSLVDRAMQRTYAPGSIEDIDATITTKQARLAELRGQANTILREFRQIMAESYGLDLDNDQARALLFQINGSSISEVVIVYSVFQQIEARLAEIRATTSNDEILRRYYGLAATLRLVTVRLHEAHAIQYSQNWIPAIIELRQEQAALMTETELALDVETNEARIGGYENNLMIQQEVDAVMADYEELLLERQTNVQERLDEAQRDAAFAINSLKTLENAAILFEQFSRSDSEFQALTQIQNSELIPLDDEEVRENYLDISRQMMGS